MILSVYASVGEGLLFLLILFVLGVSGIGWTIYWTTQRFRFETEHDATSIRQRAAAIALIVAMAMICFPPFRQIGVWKGRENDQPLPASQQNQFDRNWFGFIPSYGWIGGHGKIEIPEYNSAHGVGRGELYALKSYRWSVDAWFLAAQLLLVLLYSLPFLNARSKSKSPVES